MEQPGMLQAVVNALRNKAGLGQQQSPGPATNLQNGYREYQMSTMEQGGTPLPFEQWVQQSQQPPADASPR